jgi:hypothetical protein
MSRFAPEEVERQLARVRASCLVLPEASERLSHGGPDFFVRTSLAVVQGGRPPSARNTACFVMFLDDHHDDGRLAIWCAAPEGVQAEMVDTEPERFFPPPYLGHRGWLGVQLAGVTDAELSAICREAFCAVAPSSLLRQLTGPGSQEVPDRRRRR